MDDKHYRQLGGVLQNVLDTIAGIHERGIWLEVLTLVIPGFNDSDEELTRAARFIASVSRDIPWHVTAFHPDYKMTDRGATPVATLLRACEIGAAEGLRYVYAGNIPGRVGEWENTRCPSLRRDASSSGAASASLPQPARRRCLPAMRDARFRGAGTEPSRGRRGRTGFRFRSSDEKSPPP